MADGDKTIVFGKEIDPAEEARYREKIRQGTSAVKGREPVGVVPKPQNLPLARSGEEHKVASAINETGGVQPRPPGSGLSSETVRQIQGLAEAQVKVAEEQKVEEKPKEEDAFDLFDFAAPRNEAERLLNNKKLRTVIESRLEPMSLDELILKDEVRQTVPIVPGSFTVTYRSMTPEENLYIKRYVGKNDQGQPDQYILEKFGICQLACSVAAINGSELPTHLNGDGTVDEVAYEKKLKLLLRKSGYVIASLGVNYMWFDIRVRRLFNPDALGNG